MAPTQRQCKHFRFTKFFPIADDSESKICFTSHGHIRAMRCMPWNNPLQSLGISKRYTEYQDRSSNFSAKAPFPGLIHSLLVLHPR